jgi:putative transposase
VAASLGIAESCLHRWRQRDLIDRGLKPGTASQENAALAAAQQRIRDLEDEVKILRKAAAAVQEVVPPKVRYRLVAELQADGVQIARSCHALAVSPRVLRLGRPGTAAALASATGADLRVLQEMTASEG